MKKTKIKITLYLTNACNLNCKYCYSINNPNGNIIYNDEDISFLKNLILEKSKYYHNIELEFFGGEPLLKLSEIEKICNSLKNLKHQINMMYIMPSNLLLIDNDKFKKIKNLDINFSFSYDGLWTDIQRPQSIIPDRSDKSIPVKYDILFEKYPKIFKNIKTCHCMIYPDGIKKISILENFYYLKKELGITPIFNIIKDKGVWDNNSIKLLISQLFEFYEYFIHNSENDKLFDDIPNIFKYELIKLLKNKYNNIDFSDSCGYLDDIFITKVNNKIQLKSCNSFYIFNQDLNNTDTKNILKYINDECQNCEIYKTCSRGCISQLILNEGIMPELCGLYKFLNNLSKNLLIYKNLNDNIKKWFLNILYIENITLHKI